MSGRPAWKLKVLSAGRQGASICMQLSPGLSCEAFAGNYFYAARMHPGQSRYGYLARDSCRMPLNESVTSHAAAEHPHFLSSQRRPPQTSNPSHQSATAETSEASVQLCQRRRRRRRPDHLITTELHKTPHAALTLKRRCLNIGQSYLTGAAFMCGDIQQRVISLFHPRSLDSLQTQLHTDL